MTQEEKKQCEFLKSEVNSPKHEIMDIMHRIEEIDPKKAEKLGHIIGKLEAWQNTK